MIRAGDQSQPLELVQVGAVWLLLPSAGPTAPSSSQVLPVRGVTS